MSRCRWRGSDSDMCVIMPRRGPTRATQFCENRWQGVTSVSPAAGLRDPLGAWGQVRGREARSAIRASFAVMLWTVFVGV
jgi:hypothetical protein